MTTTVELREQWQTLLPEVAALARSATALRSITRRLSSEAGYEALVRLDKDLRRLETLEIGDEALLERARQAAREARAWLESEWGRRAAEIEEEIRAYFGERELEIEGEAPLLEAGPLDIRIDAAKDRAQIEFAGEPIRERVPLATDRLYREWKACLGRLEKDATPPMVLATQLNDAYHAVCRLRGLKPGGRVRLPDIHFQLFVQRQSPRVRQDPRRSRVKEYPRYQFAWDLAGIVELGESVTVHGEQLALHFASETAAKSRSTSVATVDDGELVYLGDLQVRAK